MNKLKTLSIIAIVSLIICIASAVIAADIDTILGTSANSWDNLGTMAWITVLVTLPAFAIFSTAIILMIILIIIKRLQK